MWDGPSTAQVRVSIRPQLLPLSLEMVSFVCSVPSSSGV